MVELRSTKTANVNNRPLGENLTNLVNLTEIAAWRHYLFCQKNGQNIYFAKKNGQNSGKFDMYAAMDRKCLLLTA
jgi:hypothetical protein